MAAEPPSARNEKVGGVILVALGALLLKLGLVDPLAQGAEGVLPVNALTLVPLSFVLGASLLVLPHNAVWRYLSRPALRDPETHRATALGWGLIALVLLPGVVLCWWTKLRLGAR